MKRDYTPSIVAGFAIAGGLLWGGHKSGAIPSLALLPLGAVFWWGFALPIPPIFALVWSALIILNWQGLV